MDKALKVEQIVAMRVPKACSVIVRRVIRAAYLGKESGDISSLENSGPVGAIAGAT